MPLNPGQKIVAQTNTRFKVVIAGRRWGKTHLALRTLALWSRHSNREVWAVYPSYRMAKQILWKPLKQKLSQLNWIEKINESELSIRLVNGSTISLKGADNYDSLRGVGLDGLILDEFADIDEQAWTEVLRPTLSDKQGQALFIGTPKGHNWAYNMYLKGRDGDNDWSSFQFTTLSGGNVPPEEIEAARQDLDLRTFRQEYEATFETYSGVVHYNFSDDNIQKFLQPMDSVKEIMLFCDFNTDPMSGIIVVRTSTGLHAIDEISMYGSNTNELASEVINRYPGKRVTAFPDPAGSQRKTSAGGNTDITILQNAGFLVKYRPQHPAVKDRINAVNSLFLNTKNERRLLIDPKCKRLIESLRKHCYKEGTQIPDKTTGWDHFCDALGYGCEYLFPVRKPVEEDRSKIFGHF